MGMSDSQFKQLLRAWKRQLEEAKAQDTKENTDKKIDTMLEDISKGLED